MKKRPYFIKLEQYINVVAEITIIATFLLVYVVFMTENSVAANIFGWGIIVLAGFLVIAAQGLGIIEAYRVIKELRNNSSKTKRVRTKGKRTFRRKNNWIQTKNLKSK
jgi:hypothetical protein